MYAALCAQALIGALATRSEGGLSEVVDPLHVVAERLDEAAAGPLTLPA